MDRARRRCAVGALLQPGRDRASLDRRRGQGLPRAEPLPELPRRALQHRAGAGCGDVVHRVRGEPARPTLADLTPETTRGRLRGPSIYGYQPWISRGASSSALPPAALAASPPRWLGDSRQVTGTRPYRLAPPLPVLSSLKSDHLLSAVVQLYELRQDGGA